MSVPDSVKILDVKRYSKNTIESTNTIKHKRMIAITYSTGLRVSELIDSRTMDVVKYQILLFKLSHALFRNHIVKNPFVLILRPIAIWEVASKAIKPQGKPKDQSRCQRIF